MPLDTAFECCARNGRCKLFESVNAACFRAADVACLAWSLMTTRARLAELGRQLKDRIAYYRALYGDPRTPWLARALLWLAIGYTLLPFDLIPDFIPVVGHLDDLVIVPALLFLALSLIPAEVKREHEGKMCGRTS